MKKQIFTLILCLLFTLLFTSTLFAAGPYLLKITVQNNLTSQFVFSSQLSPGNTCTSEGPNAVMCSISAPNSGGPLAGSLIWTNQKTPACGIQVTIMPNIPNGYIFSHWGTGGSGSGASGYIYSFPSTWNYTSDLSVEMVISGVAPGAQCAD